MPKNNIKSAKKNESISSLSSINKEVLNGLTCGVVIIDAESQIVVDFNNAAEELLGKDLNSMIGCSGCDECNVTITDKSIIEPEGSNRTILRTVNEIYLNGNKCYIENFTDITQFKELERTNKKLELANYAKSDFLANMSHEIRTPMNGVLGMTNLILKSPLNTIQREYANTLKSSGEHILLLINDILDYSKIEAGKMSLEQIDFNIRELVNNLFKSMKLKAIEKNIKLTSTVDIDVPEYINGDPGRVKQVLTNLVNNGVKFTENGSVEIVCKLQSKYKESCIIEFSVTDTGIGISKSNQELLFNKFTQVDNSIHRRFGGSGLGLTISKSLTELMGGSIGVHSMEGKGSTFWFNIKVSTSTKTPDKMNITNIKHLKVIYVDSNETDRDLVGDILSSWNICHSIVSDNKYCLELIHEAESTGVPFDIVILNDLDLGLEISRDDYISDIDLIYVDSNMENLDRVVIESNLFSNLISKPISEKDLYTCLFNVMELEKRPTSIPAKGNTQSDDKSKPCNILIVEDNATNRFVARAVLTKMGYNITELLNGAEAINHLKNNRYDLILMDIQMPVMDGFTATGIIRDKSSDVLDHDVPIIAMTANAMKGDKEYCFKAGMDDYISKPIDIERVHEVLDKWLLVENKN